MQCIIAYRNLATKSLESGKLEENNVTILIEETYQNISI
jgi:hypothetical protein